MATAPKQGFGLPTWGGGGNALDIPSGDGLFSSAGHGPPQSITPATPAPRTPTIAYNPTENSMFVNGQIVRMDDYAGLAASPQHLANPPVPKPQGDWRDVPMSSYEGIVNEIKDPSLAMIAKRNFQQALYGMQEIGYGAAGAIGGAVGATGVQDWAGRGAAQANAEQQRYAPFNYQFGTGPDANNLNAFVGSVAQAAPWLAESAVSGGTGALVGLGARGALGLAGRMTAKQALTHGAMAGIGASSYGTGIGDVYNESVEGGSPDPTGALVRGIPYALTDALPEIGALAVGLGKAGSVSKYVGGLKMPAKIGFGALGGGIAEGVNEAVQERILVDERNSIQPGYSDTPEAANRIFQSGMGGAAPGLLTGGIAAGIAPRIHSQQLANPNISTNLLTGQAVNPSPDQPIAPTQQQSLDLQGGVAGAPSGDFRGQPGFQPNIPMPQRPEVQGRMTDMLPPDFQLQPTEPNQNRLQEIRARQGMNPDQRQAPAPAPQGPNLFTGQQMSLLPDPRETIAPGRAMLMQDRRGDPRQQQAAPVDVPPGQMALKLPKVAQAKSQSLKKGTLPQSIVSARDPHTAATTNWPTNLESPQERRDALSASTQQAVAPAQPLTTPAAPAPGKTKLTKKQSSQVGLPSQPAVAVSAIHVKPADDGTAMSVYAATGNEPKPKALKKSPTLPVVSKVEPSPPEKVSTHVTSGDRQVEDAFSGSLFAQQTLDEALAAKGEMKWHNSVAQAIKQRPDLEWAIRNYVDSLTPGASKEFYDFQEGNKADDQLVVRGRRVASLKVPEARGKKIASVTATTQKLADKNIQSSPETVLHDLIRNKHNLETKDRFVTKVKDIYTKVANKSAVVGGHKLSDYFTNGEPNVIRTNNRNVMVPYEPTEENRSKFAQREKALREELNAVAQEAAEEDADEARRIANDYVSDQVSDDLSNESAADKWNTNSYVNATTGERIVAIHEVGRLRMKAAQIIGKFVVAPRVTVVPDFNSLPDFIKAHYKGKEERHDLSGVSFRDQVYIVANKIYGDDHLRAVLLHETLGHFGLRAVVDAASLQGTLSDIYDHDAVIRAEADALRSSGRYRGRENWQLVEEALSERAADIPNNIIQRLWKIIKAALRRLGFPVDTYKEPGAIARAILSAANKYVRTGEGEALHGHTPATWVNEILSNVNPPNGLATAEEVVTKNILMGGFNERRPFIESMRRSFSATSIKPNVSNLMRDLLNNVKSVNEIARRNGGFRRVFEIFQRETRRIHELLNTYNEDTKLLHSSGFSPAEQSTLGKLLVQTTRAKLPLLRDAAIRDFKLLVTKQDGSVDIDPNALEQLKAMGRFSPADFAKGIEIQHITDRALTQSDIDASAKERDRKLKMIDDAANARIAAASDVNVKKDIIKNAKRDRERIEQEHDAKLAEGVVEVIHKIREAGITIDPASDVWKAYNVARDTLDQAQIDMLLAKHATHKADAAQAFEQSMQRLEGIKKGEPSTVVKAFAKDISTVFRQMMDTNRTIDDVTGRVVFDDKETGKAHSMLDAVYRALTRDAGLKDLLTYFPQTHVAKLTDQITKIREINKDTKASRFGGNSLDFIAGLRTEFTELLGMEEAEMYAKRSIAGGHVALRRYGDYEVNIVLKDSAGNMVTPSQNWDNNLMYMRLPSQGSAELTANDLNKEFFDENGAPRAGMSFEVVDENGQSVTVTPSAFARAAETVAPLGHKISLYDFMTVADRLGVHLSAQNRETVVKALTKADSKARRGLQRGGNPGEDKDMVRVVSEQLESAAHIVANKEHKRQIDRLMANDSVWFGDKKEVAGWQSAFDATSDPVAKQKYQRLIDQWHFEYDNSSKDALYYRALANNLREWRAEQTNLIAKKENRVLANTRTFVSTAQLGGSIFNIASAAVQLFTLVTHVPAYLGTYNAKRAFGGGFGPRAYTEVVAAARDVGHYSLGNLGKLKAKLDTLNLTENEKRFMVAETKEGVFQAAAFNALQNSKLGTVRMFGQSNRANAALQKWMQFFSWSEEANRRITGLASYRLFYERALQAGDSAESAHQLATEEARQAVYITQGDYSLPNRPPWARSGFTSLIFMYKMFPILTVQLLRNLSPSGKTMFVGTMLLLGGMKSLPFAEDLLDILDGLVQRTGLGSSVTRGNAELALREFLDSFFPGMSHTVMRGLLDEVTGWSLSSRIGVGNIIPGTAFMRAGEQDVMGDLQGPAGGMMSAIYKMSTELAKGNVDRAIREQPVTAVKNIVEGYIYLNNGAILNKRGYMVADNPTTTETIGRFLGFYPERQAISNELIATTKISIDYAKELKADFVSRFVAAKMDGDSARAGRITQEVAEWNHDAKGTELELRGFGGAAGRAYAAARRPQAKMFLRSAPAAVRQERAMLEDLFGVSE